MGFSAKSGCLRFPGGGQVSCVLVTPNFGMVVPVEGSLDAQ